RAARVAHPDHDRRLLGHEPKALLALAELGLDLVARLLGAALLEAEAELAGDGDGETGLRIRDAVRHLVIGHELADHLPVGEQRDEGETADAFLPDPRLDPFGYVRVLDVGDEDRLR